MSAGRTGMLSIAAIADACGCCITSTAAPGRWSSTCGHGRNRSDDAASRVLHAEMSWNPAKSRQAVRQAWKRAQPQEMPVSEPTPITASFRSVAVLREDPASSSGSRLSWNSVPISRIMPRPDLMPMSGGYRAPLRCRSAPTSIYDPQIIIRELEQRYRRRRARPAGNVDVACSTQRCGPTRQFFESIVNLVFGFIGDKVPQDFLPDREKLRGAKFDVAATKAALPQMRDQFRAHIDWIEAQLGDNRPWMLDEFSLADVSAYMNLWYARQKPRSLDEMHAARLRASAWETRVQRDRTRHAHRDVVGRALEIAAKAPPDRRCSPTRRIRTAASPAIASA